jgi:hypothetical protein
MKKSFLVVLIVIAAYFAWDRLGPDNSSVGVSDTSDQILADAFRNGTNDLQVQGHGKVIGILPDDNDGSRHQRFILKLGSGQTLLIAHNVDLAPRIPSLHEGDDVVFCGVYEWNSKGGIIHWTHHDPHGQHATGWLKHNDRTYK